MVKLDERGKQCPLPVIEAKKALERCAEGEIVEVIVDNGIAVQNLRKMADHKGLASSYERVSDREFVVAIVAGAAAEGEEKEEEPENCVVMPEAQEEVPGTGIRRGLVAVISSGYMGTGDDELGRLLMKGFLYALGQQELLPETVLLYNGGAFFSCEGSESLEDLRGLQERGVEILTCGTCLNHYGLGDKLRVGAVTNMYEITEKMAGAAVIMRP